MKEGKLTEAADAFNKVLAKPEDRTLRMVSVARLGLAKVLVQKQEYEEAENELEKLISDEPGSPVLERFIRKFVRDLFQGEQPGDFGTCSLGGGKSRNFRAGSPGVRALLSRAIAASAGADNRGRRKLPQARRAILQITR